MIPLRDHAPILAGQIPATNVLDRRSNSQAQRCCPSSSRHVETVAGYIHC